MRFLLDSTGRQPTIRLSWNLRFGYVLPLGLAYLKIGRKIGHHHLTFEINGPECENLRFLHFLLIFQQTTQPEDSASWEHRNGLLPNFFYQTCKVSTLDHPQKSNFSIQVQINYPQLKKTLLE